MPPSFAAIPGDCLLDLWTSPPHSANWGGSCVSPQGMEPRQSLLENNRAGYHPDPSFLQIYTPHVQVELVPAAGGADVVCWDLQEAH